MSAPKRIQLRRTKGWRKPEGAVSVARPSKWGNPWRIVDGTVFRVFAPGGIDHGTFGSREAAARHAVAAYKWQIHHHPNVVGFTADDVRAELRGKDLMCFCPLDQPCHADVLLAIANGGNEA